MVERSYSSTDKSRTGIALLLSVFGIISYSETSCQSIRNRSTQVVAGIRILFKRTKSLATAQHITKILHNKFPSNYLELKKLKGVGDYTAAAIASMAFNEPVFTVDGNVTRVLSRLFAEKPPLTVPWGKSFSAISREHRQ